jgi:hypothetical protein
MKIMPASHDSQIRHSLARRPPPDYTQRGVKLRLFTYLAAIMLVAAIMERSRDPQAWQWLWNLDRLAAENAKFSNRLDDHGLRTAHDSVDTFVAASDAKADDAANNRTAGHDPVERAWEQGWKDLLARLPAGDQGLLFEMLHAATSHHTLAPGRTDVAAELIEQSQKLWNDYQATAFQSVAELKGDDQAQWIDVLRQVNGRFQSDVRPALQAVVDGRTLTEAEETALHKLQATLVALARSQVQDDTVVFRPAEREIWFHDLARVQDAQEDQLDKSSLGRVAYLQLFKQPADYRGKFVSIKGTVRLAYRAAAPANYLGVKEYFVYWIHPAGGPDAPFVVYALGAPPGFPRIADRNADAAKSQGKLHEDVTVTGIFFKRCAYPAQGGTYTAPLLIANVPDWQPPVVKEPAHFGYTPLRIAGVALAAFLLAMCLTAVLWKRSSYSHRAAAKHRFGDFLPPGKLTVSPSPEESIRELERQARGDSNA